jgi:hypothetical protein
MGRAIGPHISAKEPHMSNIENPNQGVKKTDPGRSDQEKLTPGQQEKSDPRQGQSGRPSQEYPGGKSKSSKRSDEKSNDSDDRDSE